MSEWVTTLVIALSPRRYLAICPSDFCVATCILLFEANRMWIVGLGIQTKELGTKKLYWASNRLLHGSMRTHVETTTIWVIGEIIIYKLVLHSSRYPILYM